jgi:hypothetical protein
MADRETDPLLRLLSPLKDGLEVEEQQLYYGKQRRDSEAPDWVEDIPPSWKHFSFGKFMVFLLFVSVLLVLLPITPTHHPPQHPLHPLGHRNLEPPHRHRLALTRHPTHSTTPSCW